MVSVDVGSWKIPNNIYGQVDNINIGAIHFNSEFNAIIMRVEERQEFIYLRTGSGPQIGDVLLMRSELASKISLKDP